MQAELRTLTTEKDRVAAAMEEELNGSYMSAVHMLSVCCLLSVTWRVFSAAVCRTLTTEEDLVVAAMEEPLNG
jgi:hypothetical protein